MERLMGTEPVGVLSIDSCGEVPKMDTPGAAAEPCKAEPELTEPEFAVAPMLLLPLPISAVAPSAGDGWDRLE